MYSNALSNPRNQGLHGLRTQVTGAAYYASAIPACPSGVVDNLTYHRAYHHRGNTSANVGALHISPFVGTRNGVSVRS